MRVRRFAAWARVAAAALGLLAGATVPAAEAPAFNVATYNLRLNTEDDGINQWPHRRDAVRALIRYHEFDLLATQEGLPDQIDDLAEMREFGHVGVGRDDGRREGEHSAIFYRSARFELLAQGDFWLSETPDKPSVGWDGRCCNRLASWAKLRDRRTGKVFAVFSAHFDHEGVVARRESARLILRKAHAIAGRLPIICLGDFNSTPESDAAQVMSAELRDARAISKAPPYGPVGTFNGFKLDAPLVDRIDYIFVSDRFEV
ncbi:endonuclease/exonuclease/phosphatase family protein, partial [Ideonella sp.]|uniref:endonuclease/exonuclease/phosphatase family protein n=1 Tax=Ideonella sp. TaxID=1929293 RepID=UPI002B4A3B9D